MFTICLIVDCSFHSVKSCSVCIGVMYTIVVYTNQSAQFLCLRVFLCFYHSLSLSLSPSPFLSLFLFLSLSLSLSLCIINSPSDLVSDQLSQSGHFSVNKCCVHTLSTRDLTFDSSVKNICKFNKHNTKRQFSMFGDIDIMQRASVRLHEREMGVK